MSLDIPFDAVAVPPTLDNHLTRTIASDNENNKNCGQNHRIKLLVGLGIFIIALAIFYIQWWTNQQDDDETALFRIENRAKMESLVLQEELSDPSTFADPFSAQSKALDWLAAEEDFSPNFQRYALMVVYFATNGDYWTMAEPWVVLANKHECYFSGVDCNSDKIVIGISLRARRLSGTIPKELGVLTDLEELDLGINDLQGSIPESIFTGCRQLLKLDLGFNDELSSTIPTEIGNLVQLRKLLLSSTSLSGALPESLKSLKHLHIVVLMRTNLEGPIFDFALNWPEIRFLTIGQSPFYGSFPTEIGTLSNLASLDLEGTSFNMTIPTEIGLLTNLYSLQVGVLGAHGGSIPSEIGNLQNLDRLVIQGNLFTGKIPSEIGRLSNLVFMRISGGLITGTIPSEIGSLRGLEHLDLSLNELYGNIPAEIGNLKHLSKFVLNRNNFEGRFPGKLCSIPNIFYDCSLTCDCCACSCKTCHRA